MRVSEKWLREWIDPPVSSAALAEQLTMAGLEVDSVEPVAGAFSGVVVGLVVKAGKHPDADRLNVCEVDIGQEEWVPVVCGGTNVRQGMKVAFATVGAVLPGDFKIKKAKLRGALSMGMICSTSELGMGEGEKGHIYELPADAPVGEDVRQYLALDDQVFDIELTPNRGDCLSVQGVARDVAALNALPFASKEVQCVAETGEATQTVHLQATAECPLYVGRRVSGVNNQVQTPLWMVERLRRSGLRSIHFIVDVMNYVMLELGQPMHAFDHDKLHGDLSVRLAHSGEKVRLLDEQEVSLADNMLVIADERQVLAVAGVMGGLDAAVTSASTELFLESAYFTPESIRLTARALSLQSDSSYRFERGVDPLGARKAIERASELILQYAGGHLGPVVESGERCHELPRIGLRHARIARLLGIDLSREKVVEILERLGCQLIEDAAGWQVLVPSHRHDLVLEADLIEEVARIYGYNAIPDQVGELHADMRPLPEAVLTRSQWAERAINLGFDQAMTYSFISPEQQTGWGGNVALTLSNPMSTDMSVMRSSLLPGLLPALSYNLKRQQNDVRLFEVGTCFVAQAAAELPAESLHLAMLACGKQAPMHWAHKPGGMDFFAMKGDVEQLLAPYCSALRWQVSERPTLHPGRAADIYLGDVCIGWVGQLHPEQQKLAGIKPSVFAAELNLSLLPKIERVQFAAISRFPEVRRDLALVLKADVSAGALLDTIAHIAGKKLKKCAIFDVYSGDHLEADLKSIAVSLTLVDAERTLVDDEVDDIIHSVVNGLESQFSAQLRA